MVGVMHKATIGIAINPPIINLRVHGVKFIISPYCNAEFKLDLKFESRVIFNPEDPLLFESSFNLPIRLLGIDSPRRLPLVYLAPP